MGTPFPNPKDGAAARKRERGPGGARGGRKPRAPTAKRQQDLLTASALQVPTKRQYVDIDPHNTAGPSGIKQCFRTIKSVRRIALMQGTPPPGPGPGLAPPASGKRHTCRHCGKRFGSPGKLIQHTLAHTGELPFSCAHCDKKFNSKFKLVRHGLIHSETRPFSCSACSKTFHRKDHLSNHQRIHDPKKSLYICPKADCSKQYTSQLSFKKHTALHSAEEGNLECKICSKTFERKEEIVYHLKVHAGSRTIKNEDDKKFKCPQCERKFFTGKDVRRHLVVHTGTRDFPCQSCKQEFGRKDHLVRHVKKAHPNQIWQSSVPGPSIPIPDPPELPTVSKKGKGEAKKSKTKAELKFSRKPLDTRESSKPERLSCLIEPSFLYQPDIFLPPCGMEIKMEPLLENVKIEQEVPSRIMFKNLPSTSKNVGTMMLPSVEPGPSTSLGKYEEFSPDLMYMMEPTSFPVIPASMEDLTYVHAGDLSPSLEEPILPVLEQPVVESILREEEERDEGQEREEFPYQTTPQGSLKYALPEFNKTFQKTIQSPKPPQHPPD